MVCGGCGGRGSGDAAPSRPAVAEKQYTAVDSTSRYLPGDTSSGTCTEQGTWRARGGHVDRAGHVRTEQGTWSEQSTCGRSRASAPSVESAVTPITTGSLPVLLLKSVSGACGSADV